MAQQVLEVKKNARERISKLYEVEELYRDKSHFYTLCIKDLGYYAGDQARAFILYLVADWYDKLNIVWLFVYLCIVKGCFFYLI